VRAVKGALSGDPLVRFEILRRLAGWILPQYRFKWPQMEWWNDRAFNAVLERFGESRGMNTDRLWMVAQLMRLVADVPGATAECGVYRGAGSYSICSMNERNPLHRRAHFVFDSFEGLSTPAAADGDQWKRGDMACPLDEVKRNLSGFGGVQLLKGWIPERFAEAEGQRFAFAHIDVDLYQPTLDSMMFFYPRMNDGGIILCDDYGFTSCPGATRAVDEVLRDKPEKMVALSCGGGFLIKGCRTAGTLGAGEPGK